MSAVLERMYDDNCPRCGQYARWIETENSADHHTNEAGEVTLCTVWYSVECEECGLSTLFSDTVET